MNFYLGRDRTSPPFPKRFLGHEFAIYLEEKEEEGGKLLAAVCSCVCEQGGRKKIACFFFKKMGVYYCRKT